MNKLLLLIIFICVSLLLVNLISQKNNTRDLFGKNVVIMSSTRVIQDENGNDVVVSYWDEEKFKLVYESAKRGDIASQSVLGYLYLAGEFVSENSSKAEFWLKKAAEANSYEAQFNLAYLYQKQNRIEDAIFWYRKSADLNYSEAQLNLALLLTEEERFSLNEAIRLFKKSIKNGNKKAYYPLAWWYLNEGDLNKEKEGIELLKMAVENQDPDAEFMLAELYETGDLVEQDLEKSKALYKKAREHGSLEAIEKLKQMAP